MEGTTLRSSPTTIDSENLDLYEWYFFMKRVQIFFLVSYSLVFALGTTGNGLVIFITGFRMKKTVHTIWILNLAIADFTFSFFLLFSIVHVSLEFHWPFGEALCKLSHIMVFLNLFASIYILVVISIDRCISVWCPVWAQNHRTPRLASFVALGVWILALVLCSPKLYFMKSYYSDEEPKAFCNRHYDLEFMEGIGTFYAWFSIRFIFSFIIPFSVIAVCYGAIVVRLRRDRLSQSSRPFKVITAVIVAFLVCWFPYHIFSFLHGKASYEHRMSMVEFSGLLLSCTLGFFNSCLNPVLYFCMGYNFKEKLRCSLLSALANAFTEEGSQHTTYTTARSSAEQESCSL
ncbi:chemerin-like receptor 1 [Tiliqua scincoides]|uniref:chemerin-like receptor 1 n=1 Tax=Tiliqua scincoides TaxID=71010 RepID=UPI0034628D2D